ncbi:MAG: sugar transferase [Pontiellaceae bacterium]|nr:sugar transferase [Pontiellaceae bacterium]MBN2784435.1 sugar transferase [Pontiellaceae bacterium]
MNESIYRARREMFNTMEIPVSKADIKILKWKQRSRIVFWESMLKSLFVVKRTLDIIVSLVALVILSPLMLLACILIIAEDGFPVIFSQKRVGLDGSEFYILKFRTMCRNAEQMKAELMRQNESSGSVTFKIKKDPRVLRCGRFLRRFSIDEIPQFLNVLLGDLSVVGPRPPLPEEVKHYSLSDRKRLHVKPGITCIWQISGRADIPFDGQVSLDMQYIKSQGFLTDLLIVLKTIPAVLFGRGAY